MKADLFFIALYFIVGFGLTLWVNQELRDRDRIYTYFQGPEEYTAEGQRRRRFMLRYWGVAGAGLLLLLWLL